ncbi:MAG: glycoside hydrolase family 43 protein [Actinomycetaceae bacterium]|nr:glycoside hydrolase family 43 protein [Actinomycetaceae bacterium]
MIHNPILPGFNPDPCICRKGDDFYVAVSTFEWLPGIPIYHSRDLVHWELLTHVLTENAPDLTRLPSAKGVWAPSLTYCEAEDRFYVVYSVMNSMNARYFDVDNFVISSPDIMGCWSEPVYLHSAGFDMSMLHDDGKKWVVSLEWETRDGYEKPGVICLAEYDPAAQKTVGYPKRIWAGGTDRGCIEAPHLTKRDGWYYLMCAEGGTGYNHCVTMARSRSVWGPWEGDPTNPILTSAPGNPNERHDPDHLKPKYFNPDSVLQKSGHGSYVNLAGNDAYLVHLTARPFIPELRCTLGRESAIERMRWTEDGWLRTADGTGLAQLEVPEPDLPSVEMPELPSHDDFDQPTLGNFYYSPRLLPTSFTSLTERPGWLRMRGQEARTSLNRVSLVARKLTSVYAQATTKMEFDPVVYQHSAGLIVYYDNMNYVNLRKTYSQSLGRPVLSIVRLENGTRTEVADTKTPAPEGAVYLRVTVEGRRFFFSWGTDGDQFTRIGPDFDTTTMSDEYCAYGEFTGTMVGLTCADRLFHRQCADFDFFDYAADETRPVA